MRRQISWWSLLLLLWSTGGDEALAQKTKKTAPDASAYRFLEVRLQINLRYRTTTRTRTKLYQTYRFRKKVKKLDMKNGPVRLTLKLITHPPARISIKGILQVKGDLVPIHIKSEEVRPQQEWNFVSRHALKKARAKAKLHIKARLLKTIKGKKGSLFTLKFTKVPLRRILKKLAEFNGYRLSLGKGLPRVSNITLKLQASSRKKLVEKVCQRYRLKCKIFSGVLWVKAGPPPSR
jgi:hypothetical protein